MWYVHFTYDPTSVNGDRLTLPELIYLRVGTFWSTFCVYLSDFILLIVSKETVIVNELSALDWFSVIL